MDIKKVLLDLSNTIGVSGDEKNASQTACKYLSDYAPNAYVDKFGNVVGDVFERAEGKPHFLLDAHIDEIGLIVTYITDEGFLKVSNCGGIDRRLLLAQEVTVFGEEVIKGVITSTPPHLEKDNKKTPKIDEIYIDIGMPKSKAQKIVSLGDKIVFNSTNYELLNGKLSGKSFDDRSGVACILYALDLLRGKEIPFSLSVLFSIGEETTGAGAKSVSYSQNADYAIAVDVSFALTADDSEHKCGKMGKGPMIGIAPTLDRNMGEKLKRVAEKKKIPYQLEVMNGRTGTNADYIGVARGGTQMGLISIPLKYMHTPIEVIDTEDIVNSAKLIAEFLQG